MTDQSNRGHPSSLNLPKKHLSVDIETFSSVDIGKSGSYKYIESEDFEILLFSYSFDFGAVQTIDLLSGEQVPAEVIAALNDPNVIKHAWNSAFEFRALNKFWVSPIEQWQDDMIHALYNGLTAALGPTAKVVGLPQDKQKMTVGRNLIKVFCTPTKPSKTNGNRTRTLPHHEPEKWQLFKDYNRQDVAVEMEIEKRLSRFPVPENVWEEWRLDIQSNTHGIRLDEDLIAGALAIDQINTAALKAEAQTLTELDNPNSAAQLTGWLAKRGIKVDNLQKDTVKDLVKSVADPTVKRVLEIRQQLSKTSIKKYKAMDDAICKDGRVRGLLQFYGANRTGRWAGRLVQVQNLSKNHMPALMLDYARVLVKQKKSETLKLVYGNPADTLSQLVRTAFIPAPGHKIVVADFSAIEARVIAWLSGEQWRLDVFNTHQKIYEASASQMFGVPIENIHKGDPLRQQGKVAELALGYQGSIGAMKRMDYKGSIRPADLSEEACRKWGAENGMPIPDDVEDDHQIQLIRDAMIDANYLSIVHKWREKNPAIVRLWRALENTALSVMRTGRPAGTHGLLFARESDIRYGLDFLTITLPSRRKLYYAHPFLAENDFGKEALHYYGMDQTTHKWVKISTYGGKLTENCLAGKTIVLTNHGWKNLVNTKKTDLLWDGNAWVKHDGLVNRGKQKTILIDGIRATPDHLFLTKEGWKHASSCTRYHRYEVKLPDGISVCRFGRKKVSLGNSMRLRKKIHYARNGIFKGKAKIMRMHARKANRRKGKNAWHDPSSRLRRLALNDPKMHRAHAPSMAQLWRTWNKGLQPMASRLQKFLGRYGADIQTWADNRADRRQRELRAKQLHLGDMEKAGPKQAGERLYQYKMGTDYHSRGLRKVRSRRNNHLLSNEARMAGRLSANRTRFYEPVFDIKNAGPRHRFTVLGEKGPVIVHNCVQAIARDILAINLNRLARAGYQTVMTIHDEVVLDVPAERADLDAVVALMKQPIEWAPGLPLNADGFVNDYYKKDD